MRNTPSRNDITKGIRTVYARNAVEVPAVNGKPVVIEVPSSSGTKMYRVDITLGRCSCPGWTLHAKNGKRKPCKHLIAFGFSEV